MENTVDDFFNEINQIAPPKERRTQPCDWQECLDNSSGYSYYWNMKTDQVTWTMPHEYKLWKEQNTIDKKNVQAKKSILFPSALPSNTKIYNIQKELSHSPNNKLVSEDKQKEDNDNLVNNQEKVVLIPAYGEGSDSESEPETDIKNGAGAIVPDSQTKDDQNSKNNSDDEDIDILAKIQNRAKILKDLGGELPPDVKKIVEQNGSLVEKELEKKVKKNVSGFSLVAGYGESDDEDEELKAVETSNHRIPVSTLFPIPKPIDVKQFLETEKPLEPQEEIDTKAFHRKRRIGIDFNVEKSKVEVNEIDNDRQGLGFKCEGGDVSQNKSKISYPGFKSAGVLFAKSDIINTDDSADKKEVQEDCSESTSDTMKKVEETHKMLNEKLTFLSEGREPVSPVQAIIIQMETLYEAMQAGSLTLGYLLKWLKQTCSELIKLEKEAAPSGWLLQWDRINKRYYYRNQQTGESQWEYPQPDIVAGDDAMDICTTPPPTASETLLEDLAHTVQPPPPPRIKTPTPPPPPTISKNVKQRKKNSAKIQQIALDVLPELPSSSTESIDEPLPPGVDSPPESFQLEKKPNDVLGSELDSFYSDLAAMETTTNTVSSTVDSEVSQIVKTTETTLKRKKKPKVKLVEGLAMKKKGVSKLVERWKNVQKDL
ncbi:hypothetical protein RN001_005899 [Aquatica leii]|uniref:WW domain-containing protein n=1 Tax=Aquatica leii TaxID=1421715 RepID=A0AAN7P763_9COLE|nr:hypothetical protein RN001_005899 [Aquatica leii]